MIVFDSSTLILLAEVELVELFLEHTGEPAVIPSEVQRECCCEKQTFDALLIQKMLDASRIRVVTVKNKKLIHRVESDFNLGRGEAEAIALAVEKKARLIGIDDKNGINACKLLGLPFTTAVAVLVRACQQHWVTGGEALSKLQRLAQHGRYKGSIIEDARARLGGYQ